MGSEVLVNGHHSPPNLLYNDNSKPWIVQKFGGTSVGKFPHEIADKIVRYAQPGVKDSTMHNDNLRTVKASSALA